MEREVVGRNGVGMRERDTGARTSGKPTCGGKGFGSGRLDGEVW